MKTKILTLFFTTSVALGLSLFDHKAYAKDFVVSYNTEYKVMEDAQTQITQAMTIKNLNSKIFATSYTLTINQLKVFDIEAKDKRGNLKTSVSEKDNKTTIITYFNSAVLGEGTQLSFELKYKTKEIAYKNGRILEVNIPKAADLSEVESYNVSILIPDSFGPVMFMSINPQTKKIENGYKYFTFDTSQVASMPISATFGDYQFFNFKLSYSLENNSSFPAKSSIALPSDIPNYQQVYYASLSPQPLNISIDKDGNYIAWYAVPAKSVQEITLTGSAKITNTYLDMTQGGKFSEIPDTIRNTYTLGKPYWEVSDIRIQKIATELKNTDLTVGQNAAKIYQYVTSTLKYRNQKTLSDRVERLGAVNAIENPDQAICMEYVDLFIALARAMGIPAREVDGYAFTKDSPLTPLSIDLKNGDVLHAWAQFYDPNLGWVMIDPTWGATSGINYFNKLDTNHIAFVTKGVSSDYPLPAGSYKTDSSKKQVDISFSLTDSENSNYKTQLQVVEERTGIWDLISQKKTLSVINNGNSTVFNVNNEGITLPPFSEAKIHQKLDNGSIKLQYETFSKNKIVEEIAITKDTRTKSNSFFMAFIPIVLGALLLYAIAYFLAARLMLLRKQSDPRHPHPPVQDQ